MTSINYLITIAVIGFLASFAVFQTKKPCDCSNAESKPTTITKEIKEVIEEVKDNSLQKRVQEMPLKLFPLGPK